MLGVQVERVAHELEARRAVRWVFVTLTVRNCQSWDLGLTLNEVLGGLKRFTRQAWFARFVVGWFRTLEVTRNAEDGSWHPHVHMLVALRPSYFLAGNYRRHEVWVADWRRAARLLYDPSVRVQRVGAVGDSVAEVSKYVAKPGLVVPSGGGVTARDRETVEFLVSALRGRRLVGFGGAMRDIWSELEASGEVADAEAPGVDLVQVRGAPEGCGCQVCGGEVSSRVYRWVSSSLGYRG